MFQNITALKSCWSVMPSAESVSVTNDELDILSTSVLLFLLLAVKSRLSVLCHHKQGL